MSQRKFCWIYQNKKLGHYVLVQRPHRRAADPTYWVKDTSLPPTIALSEVRSSTFRKRFRYVARAQFTDDGTTFFATKMPLTDLSKCNGSLRD
jgi:hypothetical protein